MQARGRLFLQGSLVTALGWHTCTSAVNETSPGTCAACHSQKIWEFARHVLPLAGAVPGTALTFTEQFASPAYHLSK